MILRLSVMPCLWVSDDAYNLSFRVLKGSGGGAEHWVPIKCPQLQVVESPDLIHFRFVIIIISLFFLH